MSHKLEHLNILVNDAKTRYEETHPSYEHQIRFLQGTEDLSSFLSKPHKQFVPGGKTASDVSKETSEDVKAGDKAVKKYQAISAPTEDDINEMAEAFMAHPSSAVTTLLNEARAEAGWNPVTSLSKASADGFVQYTDLIARIRQFEIIESSTETFTHKETSYKKLIDNVANALSDVFTGKTKQVKSSLNKLADACTSQVNTTNTACIFSQGEVTSTEVDHDNEVVYALAYSWMEMTLEHESGKSAPADYYTEETKVLSGKFRFLKYLLTKGLAKKLAELQFGVCTLEEFIAATTTPEAERDYESCLKSPEVV